MKPCMSRITWEWLAGFFDGEGSVSIHLTFTKSRVKSRNIVPRMKVMIPQTQREKLEEIKNFLEYGRIEKAGFGYSGNRAYMIAITNCKDAEKFAKSIMPYINFKRRLFELLLEFTNLVQKRKRGAGNLWLRDDFLKVLDIIEEASYINKSKAPSKKTKTLTYLAKIREEVRKLPSNSPVDTGLIYEKLEALLSPSSLGNNATACPRVMFMGCLFPT